MRILVDTSVWSQWLRQDVRLRNPVTDVLERSIHHNDEIFLTALIVQEVLQGLRKEGEFCRIEHFLDSFPLLSIDRGQAVLAAKICRQCASKGITTSSVDCQIAAAATAYDCFLLSADKDFEYIARHTDLRLFEEKSSR